MIFRTAESKNDLISSWNRPDRPFFAAGACHILAAVFLETYPNSGYCSFHVVPGPGLRGAHLFVSNDQLVFDYHGYVEMERYLAHFTTKMARFFPGWHGQIKRLDASPVDESFCHEFQHRLPSQYLHDPRPRALDYIKHFPPPCTPLGQNFTRSRRN
jgi:hypothetical protein